MVQVAKCWSDFFGEVGLIPTQLILGEIVAADRKRAQEEWLRFCYHMGFSHWISHMVFPSVCGPLDYGKCVPTHSNACN